MNLIICFVLTYVVPNEGLLRKGIEAGYLEQYERAESLLLEYTRLVKESPLGPLFLTGLYDLYMLDFSDDSKRDKFFKYIDLTVKRSERVLKGRRQKDPREIAWAYFAKGAALSYKAIYYGRKKNFIKALYYAFPAKKALDKAVKIDSTLYDAYLPLGTYDYALSELPKFVKWLAGGRDRREKALREMRLAAYKGKFVEIVAKDALIWTLAYHRSFKEAENISQELLKRYPASRTFRWTYTYILRRSGQWKRARDEYQKLLYLVMRDQKSCPYCVAIVYMWLSRSAYFSRGFIEARRYALAGKILTSKVKSEEDREYLEKTLKWVLDRTGG